MDNSIKTYEIFTTNHSEIHQAGSVIEAIEKAGNPNDLIGVRLADQASPSKGVQKIGDGRIVFEGKIYVNEESKRVIPNSKFTPSPLQQQDKGTRDEVDEFLEYARVERNEFVTKFWKMYPEAEQRVVAENLLITYDQLRERLRTTSPQVTTEEEIQTKAKEFAGTPININDNEAAIYKSGLCVGYVQGFKDCRDELRTQSVTTVGESARDFIESKYGLINLTHPTGLDWDDVIELMEAYRTQTTATTVGERTAEAQGERMFTKEEMGECYEAGVSEGGSRASNYAWGIRRKDIEFSEWFADLLTSLPQSK